MGLYASRKIGTEGTALDNFEDNDVRTLTSRATANVLAKVSAVQAAMYKAGAATMPVRSISVDAASGANPDRMVMERL